MINSVKNTWIDFRHFLRNPKDQKDPVQKLRFKGERLLSILAIDVVIMCILMAILYSIEQAGFFDSGSNKIYKQLQILPLWSIILFGAFIIPFIEELIFRLYLRLKHNYPVKVFLFISSITGNNKDKITAYISSKWEVYYKVIFYLSAVVFALVHMTNYESSFKLLIFAPILLAPQFIMGLFTGYLRVKYGLLWGFYLHSLHNLIFLAIPLILMSGPVEKLNVTNAEYELRIEEIKFGKLEMKSRMSPLSTDSIFFENFSLRGIIPLLADKGGKLIEYNSEERSNQKINLTFKSYSHDLDPKEVILNELKTLYNFSITKYNVLQEAWMLQISDTTLLAKHKNDSLNASTMTVTLTNEVKLGSFNLDQLTGNLNWNYDKYILTEITLADRFDFRFQKNDFDDLKIIFKNEYGLIFKKHEMEIEHLKVDFKKDKDRTQDKTD